MKIVWVSHSGNTQGGAERCLWEAAGGTVARGHEVHAVLPTAGPLVERLKREGVESAVIPYPPWVHSAAVRRPPFYYHLRRGPLHFRAARSIARLLQAIQPDVVMTNTLTVPAGAMAARRAGIPHLWYFHEFGREDHNLGFDFGDRQSTAFMDRHSRLIPVNSKAVREKYARFIPEAKMRVVYAGVEIPPHLEARETEESGTLRLLLMGQVIPGKRQEDAIRAVALLRGRGRDVHLSLVGSEQDPAYLSRLRRLAWDLGLEDAVEFAGHTEDPYNRYNDADVALVCSQSEAFGRVTVEAMKMGRAVVGAASGGTTELIRDGWNGLLYRPGDAGDLAETLETLYGDRPLLREMGARAQRWADETFTLEGYVDRLLETIQEGIEAAKE